MGLADLPPGVFVTESRDDIVTRYKRNLRLRNPAADVTSGQPDMDARLIADVVAPIYSDAKAIVDGINEDDATDERLDRAGERVGVKRPKERGASGYVAVTASAGGGTLQNGVHELQDPQTRLRFEIAEDAHKNDGEHIRVRARDVGPSTDLAPGTVLKFTNPPPGIGQHATVVEQSEGRGLTGGAERASDSRYLDLIRSQKRNPAAGDNDAELMRVIMDTPDVPVEQVFTYPGYIGPGTTAFTFTVLAPTVGASRLPTAAQVQAAADWLTAQMPGDGSYFPLVIEPSEFNLAFAVSWATGGWADPVTWPEEYSDTFLVTGSTSATAFILGGSGTAPVAGQTIAFWDKTKRTFRRKRIATVTGGGPYTIACDTTNGASDTSFTPTIGLRACPWSDNLDVAAQAVLAYLATLGPCELFAAADIPSTTSGRRRIRQPEAPKLWPFKVTNKLTTDIASLTVVADAVALAGVGFAVVPGLPARILSMIDLSFFPQT